MKNSYFYEKTLEAATGFMLERCAQVYKNTTYETIDNNFNNYGIN